MWRATHIQCPSTPPSTLKRCSAQQHANWLDAALFPSAGLSQHRLSASKKRGVWASPSLSQNEQVWQNCLGAGLLQKNNSFESWRLLHSKDDSSQSLALTHQDCGMEKGEHMEEKKNS